MAGTQFSKECKDCHQQIVMQKQGDGTWKALNPDFTPHICTNGSKAQAPATPNGSAVIGRITEYEGSNVHVGKKILFILPEYRNSWKEKYPIGTPVSATVDKGTCKIIDPLTGPNLEKFLKQEEAQKQQQPLPEEKPPAQQPPAAAITEKPKETPCTSPSTSPARQFPTPSEAELVAMAYNSETYWKAKMLLDIKRCQYRSWEECVSLANQFHGITNAPIEDIFETSEKIHTFIKGKAGGVS